uniref:DUF4283 domain-containing protein n=1 Tax=Tanacetum cinerariifolium TaxID=118510 RepID=A0A699INH7_TANCI|nr:hypothetical protein [Tanacetum cinerariifolium]
MNAETFPTVSEVHGFHSPTSANEENLNDAGTNAGPTSTGNTPVVSVESIRAISERFANTAYGFFVGKRVAYPVVADYVINTWGKYELVKSKLNSSTKIFSFQFSSIDDLDAMLENGPRFIRNNPLIPRKWNPVLNLLKKMSSYARALIRVRVDVELKDNIVVVMSKHPTIEVSNSNTFDLLNSVESVDDLGTNGGTLNLTNRKANSSGFLSRNVESSSTSTTLMIEKFAKMEKLIIEGKVTLVDDDGKPLKKVDSSGDHDSEDEVA